MQMLKKKRNPLHNGIRHNARILNEMNCCVTHITPYVVSINKNLNEMFIFICVFFFLSSN